MGLLYYGWDESCIQCWLNFEMGCFLYFWVRVIGWYCMGLVDVLEYFLEDYVQYFKLVVLLQCIFDVVLEVQDVEIVIWWQVLDLFECEGNYFEFIVLCMFSYVFLKGVNEGWFLLEYGQ